MEQESIFVGIDVAKAQLDVAVRPADDRWEISHDDAGIGQLVSQLKSLEPAMVLVEASGGLELPLVAALASEELPVVTVQSLGKPESTEGGRLVSILKWPEGAPVNLG